MLIERGVNINDVNQNGDPIIVFAARKGKIATRLGTSRWCEWFISEDFF